MNTVNYKSGKAAEVRREVGMRLPLELIFIILECIAASSEQRDLMYLRLVSSKSNVVECCNFLRGPDNYRNI